MQVTIKQLIDFADLEILAGKNGLNNLVTDDEITTPGVEFSGYFDYFVPGRIALIGSKEANFLYSLNKDLQLKRVEELFSHKPQAIIFSKNVKINQYFIDFGNKTNIPVLRSELRTTPLTSKLYSFLKEKLSERIGVHGVLIDINGMGTLITGKSGIGKSETALELLRRGHQLVADDLVEIYEREVGTLVGTSPEMIKGFIEVRGVGVINVIQTFGIEAFRDDKTIRLVIQLVDWDENAEYDRLGLDNEYQTFFNTDLPKLTIPVKTGRNMAVVIESAAMNEKLKYFGYNAAMDLTNKVNHKVDGER